ncbi:SDR family NAD(P)-dependent oxidoreductase [Nonomuraea sp. NPDC003804]|uniref:type I polyketide synthase n=1 Tax=Nonomuraea sp. NPDC003804 TaxID=3154547 RepID=UPI0033B4961C
MSSAIAIVGTGCRYPDARDPGQLWELVLSRRRAFRPIPTVRLGSGYRSSDPGDPDRTYVGYAAVLEGWEFDRSRFRIPGPVYRATDPAHWLALEVAADTLADAGYGGAEGLDRRRVGVVVGNTMAGEFSRAAALRLRWPYVEGVMREVLAAEDPARLRGLLARAEQIFKAPFAEPSDETLAGGLANTIAGRICNYFDLGGGGYTVDGACSSSLLAVITACTALREGEVDFALAGGVDLSLDPFELVGFARTGALANGAMRVYDARPTGFWPGEGCGMVALMRLDDALAAGRAPVAVISGWGVSSDGQGGITRPERGGQLLAIERAYRRAGWGPETVSLFEGHGTGTAVGDSVELAALMEAQRGGRELPPAALGSIKANIGHTKAAAGVAGLLKAATALQRQVIPPTTGCEEPHELLRAAGAPLRVVAGAEPWPDAPLRAAVSAMGFGGINAHVVLEAAMRPVGRPLTAPERSTAGRPRGHEAFVFAADTVEELAATLARTAEVAAAMSFADHVDLAASLAVSTGRRRYRAGIVARDPAQLGRRAGQAAAMLAGAGEARLLTAPGIFVSGIAEGRVGLLFTGQGAPVPTGPGALASVLPEVRFGTGERDDGPVDTSVAQPQIFSASMAGLRWLDRLGVSAVAAAGHSLGEITALCWAGAFSEPDALDLVTFRGQVMSEEGEAGTGMAAVHAPAETVAHLIDDTELVISADNGASQVVGGPVGELERVLARAREAGLQCTRLQVSHAFHTRAMLAAEWPLSSHLAEMEMAPISRPVYSTILGAKATPATDLRRALAAQVTGPVLFRQAVELLSRDCDLLVEVGPGRGLATLAAGITDVPAVSLDVGAASAEGLCQVAAALHAVGAVDDLRAMFAAGFHRPFDLWRDPSFLVNPCERTTGELPAPAEPDRDAAAGDVDALVRDLVAAALELPSEAISESDLLIGDLHLNSLRVAQLVVDAANACDRAVPELPPSLADATVADLMATVRELPSGAREAEPTVPRGLSPWHRLFVPEAHPVEPPDAPAEPHAWQVHGLAPLRDAVEPRLVTAPHGPPAVLVFLPADPGDQDIAVLVDASRQAVAAGTPLVVIDQGDTASGFAGTLRQEHPGQIVRLVRADCPGRCPVAAEALAKVIAAPAAMADDLLVDDDARIFAVTHRPLEPATGAHIGLGPDDVALVTGGGRGIGLETALALASRGVRLALLGRGDPDHDEELRANLERLREAGAAFHYIAADVCDAAAVRRGVAQATRALGPITALVHSSGVNRPARFTDLSAADFAEHAAPKVGGLRTVLDALDTDRIRVVITYGSVIGRYGLHGEAHYALANGRMRELVRTLRSRLPAAYVCNLDWTAWSGAGMGERLHVVHDLERAGVTPLPAARGVQFLLQVLATRPEPASIVISGRHPALDRAADTAPGTARYLEHVRLHVPGVELVAEAILTAERDAFLADHRIDGLRVLPAVCAMEAMAQAARLLTGQAATCLELGRFTRPIVVPEEGGRTIRICAQVREDKGVDVAILSDETGFAVDHFSCRVAGPAQEAAILEVPARRSPVPPHEAARLYGPLFFHGPAFQLLRGYEHLEATACTAVLAPGGAAGDTELGDHARNDATIHVLQACVPHRRLLPVGCDRLTVHRRAVADDHLVLAAAERSRQGADYTYDVVVSQATGEPVVTWEGLRLRDVGPLPAFTRWPRLLLRPYLTRALASHLPGADVELDLGEDLTLEVLPPDSAMLAGAELARAVPDGADPWPGLTRELVRLAAEPVGHVLARTRGLRDCLARAGRDDEAPPEIQGVYDQGWAVLRAGDDLLVSALVQVEGADDPVAITAFMEGEQCALTTPMSTS